MFGKKDKQNLNQHISTIISDGCVIDGNIKSNSSIKIDGVVKGNVYVQSGVILGNTGKVTGDINAKEAIIHGLLEGNIQVEKIEIRSTGKISGDINTNSMEMEFGAVYNGKVNMTNSQKTSNTNKSDTIESNLNDE